MQAKKPRKEKIINPSAQAPNLIKEVKRKFDLTQDDLAVTLKITQQAVSDYEAGYIWKERHDVITALENMLSGKTAQQSHSPAATQAAGGDDAARQEIREALINGSEEAFSKRKRRVLPNTSGIISPRGIKKRR